MAFALRLPQFWQQEQVEEETAARTQIQPDPQHNQNVMFRHNYLVEHLKEQAPHLLGEPEYRQLAGETVLYRPAAIKFEAMPMLRKLNATWDAAN